MRYILILFSLPLLLMACSMDGYQTMSVNDLLDEFEEHGLTDESKVYIDVREVNEYTEAHIEGFTNIPMLQVMEDPSVLPEDKEIVILCRTDNRSAQVAESLIEQGFDASKITIVTGGITQWSGPTVRN